MVQMSTQGARTSDEWDSGGEWVKKPGIYHVLVDSADCSFEKCQNGMIFGLQVLAGTEPDQIGKTHNERVYLAGADAEKTAKCVERAMSLAVALGLLTKEQADAAIGGGQDVDVPFEASVGRQLVVRLKADKYTDKDGNERPTVKCEYFGFLSVVQGIKQGVPMDADALQALGIAYQPGQQAQTQQAPKAPAPVAQAKSNGNGNGNPKPATHPQTAAKPGGSPFADYRPAGK